MANFKPSLKNGRPMSNDYARESTNFRNKPAAVTPVPILVLSSNAVLLETVGRSVPSGAQVVEAATIDAAMQQLYSVRPGLVLIDTMSCKDITGSIAQMMQELPNLTVVIA